LQLVPKSRHAILVAGKVCQALSSGISLFDVGQGLSEHTSPFDALAEIMDGEAEITISGKPILVKSGEVVLLPAGEPHALKAIARFKMLLTMIRS
jgi:quercetin dioxygenase-like cupin family protein